MPHSISPQAEETLVFVRILHKCLHVSIILPIFAPSKDKVMEDKRYPTVEEENSGGKVSEPIAAPVPDTMPVEGLTEVHDWIDDLDWDNFPSFGPFSDEEAIARIDRFEERLRKGEVKWTSSEQVWEELYSKYPWLR